LCSERVEAKTFHAYRDEEIVHRIEEIRPQVVAVDAPLSLPAGRKSIEEKTSNAREKSIAYGTLEQAIIMPEG
jgi:predicted nuclease with RNAse H fold